MVLTRPLRPPIALKSKRSAKTSRSKLPPGKTSRDFSFRRIPLEDALAMPEAKLLFPE